MTLDEFLRVFRIRSANLAFLLGAGASAAAGIPTAADLIWQFKRTLYCTAQRVSVKTCDDLSSSSVRQRLNQYFASLETFPPDGAPEEYAAYFEATYPDASDRRAVLGNLLTGVSPSYGHLVFAALMQMQKLRMVWTPNFDKLIEDAAFQMLGSSSAFTVATLDNSETALQAMNEGRWPLIAKLHGDFQSRRLKNTSEELKSQDGELRRALLESCRRYGLVLVGYSGRDNSILEVLEQAIDQGHGYPSGLFWLHRTDSPVLQAVMSLIAKASAHGVQAEMVEIQTFDELLGDVIGQFSDVPADIQAKLTRHRSRITDVSVEMPGRGWPVIRLNALPVLSWPSICRRIDCTIGGAKAVREAITAGEIKAIGTRSRAGVLAFGSDEGLKRAFTQFEIKGFDCHSIEPDRLHSESTELGLLRDALAEALRFTCPLQVRRVRSDHLLIPDLTKAPPSRFAPLLATVGELKGAIPQTTLTWMEALRVRLDYKLGRMWLLVEPTIEFDRPNNLDDRFRAASFVRERLATRYNRQWNALIDSWLAVLMESRQELTIRAFGIDDGIDASFTLSRTTGFSRPVPVNL